MNMNEWLFAFLGEGEEESIVEGVLQGTHE